MARTSVGSMVATVRVEPSRLSGRTWYFRAVSGGMSLTTEGLTLKTGRLMEGRPNWRAQNCADVVAGDPSQLDQAVSQAASVDPLVLQGPTELLPADEVFSDQQVTEVDRHETGLPQAHPRQ